MKEYQLLRYGNGGDVYVDHDVPSPALAAGEVRIRVGAFALNPVDLKTQKGESKLILPFAPPFVPGVDLAGTVKEVGADVKRLRVGDAVFSYTGMDRMGAFAQEVVLDEARVVRAPARIPLERAAAMPLPVLTALQALEAGNVRRGSRVLIHGGMGAVGSMAVQHAVYLGADVSATVSGNDADQARAMGVNQVIDYRNQRFEDVLHDLDFVFDTVGGDTLDRSFRVLKQGGTLATLHLPPRADVLARAGLQVGLLMRCLLPLVTFSPHRKAARSGLRLSPQVTVPDTARLSRAAALIDEGVLRPHLDRVFQFGEFKEALEYFSSGKARGRVVVLAG